MAAQLNSTVYVQDPKTRQTVVLEEGTSPEPRLAALVTNPSAWVDGKLPPAAEEAAVGEGDQGNGPDGASGDASDQPAEGDQTASEGDKPEPAKKTAARKTAAKPPARGREAAEQGDGSH